MPDARVQIPPDALILGMWGSLECPPRSDRGERRFKSVHPDCGSFRDVLLGRQSVSKTDPLGPIPSILADVPVAERRTAPSCHDGQAGSTPAGHSVSLPWANWISHRSVEAEIAGSSPVGGAGAFRDGQVLGRAS